MVSGAIVISVQSTSVKAANLLASFIIIPVAFLVQGESVMLFWGNGKTLWLALLGVIVLASLLIRVGIAHFQREYLLGREIDVLNLRWVWATFWRSFKGGATSIGSWYRGSVLPALGRLVMPMLVMFALALIGGGVGYQQVSANAPALFENMSVENISDLRNSELNIPGAEGLNEFEISAPFIFMNNMRATTLMFLAGAVSFGVLGIMFYLVNVSLVGAVLSMFAYLGVSPFALFAAGILPHGMFELPALLLSGSAVLYMAVSLVTPQTGKSMGEVVISLLADWAKIFIGVVMPLLLIAAIVETYVTPAILVQIFHW